jgi:hypothetical protein
MAAFAVALAYKSITKKLYFFAFFAFVGAAGLAIIDQNTHVRGVICLIALFAVCQELIRRSLEKTSPGAPEYRVKSLKCLACLGLLLMFIIEPILYRTTSMAIIHSTARATNPQMPGQLQQMVFMDYLNRNRPTQPAAGNESGSKLSASSPTADKASLRYLESIKEGAAMLEQAGTNGKSVSVLDFVNPFSFALDMVPSTGGHTCLHYGQVLSEKSSPSPEELLGAVDYAMIPRFPIDPRTTDFLVKTYGGYLNENFEKQPDATYWILWKRKTPPASSPGTAKAARTDATTAPARG